MTRLAALSLALVVGSGLAACYTAPPPPPTFASNNGGYNNGNNNGGYNNGGGYNGGSPAAYHVQQAQQAAGARDYATAMAALEEAQRQDERYAEIYGTRASILAETGSLGVACSELKKYRYFSNNPSAQVRGVNDDTCGYNTDYTAGTAVAGGAGATGYGVGGDMGMVTTGNPIQDAEAALAAEDEIRAMVFIDEAERQNSANPDVFRLRASVYKKLGEVDKACRTMTQYFAIAGTAGPVSVSFLAYMKEQNHKVYPACKR